MSSLTPPLHPARGGRTAVVPAKAVPKPPQTLASPRRSASPAEHRRAALQPGSERIPPQREPYLFISQLVNPSRSPTYCSPNTAPALHKRHLGCCLGGRMGERNTGMSRGGDTAPPAAQAPQGPAALVNTRPSPVTRALEWHLHNSEPSLSLP